MVFYSSIENIGWKNDFFLKKKSFKVTQQNVPPSLPSPIDFVFFFLWPLLLGQIGSAKQRACNRDVRHFWQGDPTLRRPNVIHKHDGLAVIFLHLQHKRREWEEENESREGVLVSDAP